MEDVDGGHIDDGRHFSAAMLAAVSMSVVAASMIRKREGEEES